MTKEEAISILGGGETQIEEFVTQEVFDLKTNLLKGALVPQVLFKKADKLCVIADALEAVGFEDEKPTLIESILNSEMVSSDHLISFYRTYESELSLVKLGLMRAFHPRIVAGILFQLGKLEEQRLLALANCFSIGTDAPSVKLSDVVDSGVILQELKKAKKITLKELDLNLYPTLQQDVVKSIKYLKFVEAKSTKEC